MLPKITPVWSPTSESVDLSTWWAQVTGAINPQHCKVTEQMQGEEVKVRKWSHRWAEQWKSSYSITASPDALVKFSQTVVHYTSAYEWPVALKALLWQYQAENVNTGAGRDWGSLSRVMFTALWELRPVWKSNNPVCLRQSSSPSINSQNAVFLQK